MWLCGLIGEARMIIDVRVWETAAQHGWPCWKYFITLSRSPDEFHAPVLSLKLDRLVYVTLRKLAHAIYRDFSVVKKENFQ